MNHIKSAFKLSCVFAGTVIGAGFASGQEVWRFFGRFGINGIWGVIISALLLGFIGSGMMLKIHRLKINTYEDFCIAAFGRKISGFVAMVSVAFMFACFCVMLAGSGAMFEQELGLDSIYGISFLSLICFMTFLFDIRGVTVLNTVLSPLMLLGMLILGLHQLAFADKQAMSSLSEILSANNNWTISAFVYVSYNLLTVPAVIAPMQSRISGKKAALMGGWGGGLLLGLGGLMILAVCISGAYISAPLPALAAAKVLGDGFQFYYCLVIFMAMLTTAAGCGMGFIKYLSGKDENSNIAVQAALICFCGGCLAMLGFEKLVEHFYTIFGYLGLFITVILIKESVVEMGKVKNRI